jgi:NAD(P)-dependent dehydrogenase (short-subunit alcohol dehydrogenase family)
VTAAGLHLRGAVVVVTGGGSGIGAAMVRRFAAEGARVVVNDLDGAAAKAVADEVGGRAVAGDAADPAAVRSLVDQAFDEPGALDLFCANAGVALCPQGVNTPMLNRPGPRGAAARLLDPDAISPEQVADAVVEAMADDRFLVLPHPEVATYYSRRAADPDRWLRGMNRLQRTAVEPALGPAGSDLL